MPRYDGTGPEGKGPKSGRGAGNCGDQSSRPTPRAPFRGRRGR